jgi:pimeloyl-ACP methyl ester carboxylesterase
MAEPLIAAARLAGSSSEPTLLVVGPSLGTEVRALWGACAAMLASRFEVVGWDLPGHGASPPAAGGFTVGELAAAVRALAGAAAAGRPAVYAGVSIGGAVAFEIGLDPGPFQGAAAIASASAIGGPSSWTERIHAVQEAGTSGLRAGAAARWFAPGFAERDSSTANRLLASLSDADDHSYALACQALAAFDRRGDLGRIRLPFLLGPGEVDGVVPPARAQEDAGAIPGGRLQIFAGCAHLPPAEAPGLVAAALTAFFAPTRRPDDTAPPSAVGHGVPGSRAGR